MKLCPQCKLRKPDAVFKSVKAAKGRCLSCCTAHIGRAGGRKKERMQIRTFQAEPIDPTKEDAKMIALGRRELKKFERRGSPNVERPYVFVAGDPAKGIVAKILPKG